MYGVLDEPMMSLLAVISPGAIWSALWPYLLIFAGFSAVIFVHELGHFLAAKWAGVRVERFAIGFFKEVVGFTWGETRYSFNVLPLGGYVKMLGQEDFEDKGNELRVKDDPRAFTHKPVGKRMIIVSAGVVMNILFAAFLFVIVFMHGQEEPVTTIGQVIPESPAARAGLQPGDTILSINDKEIREYQEVRFAVILADPHTPIDFEIDRRGTKMHLAVLAEPDQQRNLLHVGIMPATTREVVIALGHQFDVSNPAHLRAGDKVVAIEGQPLDEDGLRGGIEQLMRSADGSPVNVTVERSRKDDPEGVPERLEVQVFNEMFIDPSDPLDDRDTRNLLGLIPLVRVTGLDPRGRAALGGLQEDDVITKWGEYESPTQKQITDSIRKSVVEPDPKRRESWRTRLYDSWTWNPETSIAVRVERKGRPKPIWREVTPKAGKKGRPTLAGFRVNAIANENLLVAGVLDHVHGKPTPAYEAGIPSGAVIREVNGKKVASWHDLTERFRINSGSTVALKYETAEGESTTCDFRVPHSLRTVMNLSTLANIIAIDDQKFVSVQGRERRVKLSAGFSYGLYKLLRQRLDEDGGKPTTVSVRYQAVPYGEELQAEVTLSEDMIDPWLGRIRYAPTSVFMKLQLKMLKAAGPIDALYIGGKKTAYFVLQVYTMLERMIVSRSVGVENMSGPVGIVKIGSDMARVGFVKLLFFVAIISANLAVINFLPLPIMDGGLMVFLLVEKIKGSPVSLKVQVVTQMIGLFLIGAAFLFVTLNDVIRLAG